MEAPPAAAIEARLVPTAAGVIEVADVGSGPAILWVHGLPGSWRQLRALASELATSHRGLLVSRPGYGRTPLSTGRGYGEQARAYVALLDALGIPDAVVVGVSGGGPSSVAMARLYPERVRALVLCCALEPASMRVPLPLRVAANIPGLGEAVEVLGRRRRLAGLEPEAVRREMRRSLTADELARAAADPQMEPRLRDYRRAHAEAPPAVSGVRNDVRQMMQARRQGVDTSPVGPPMLVLHGDADAVVPLAHGHHYAALQPAAEITVYDGAGHIFLLTRWDEAVDRLRAFLSKV